MPIIDEKGYISVRNRGWKNSNCKGSKRNFWLVQHHCVYPELGVITLKEIKLPKEYIGKRVRFKIEIVPDDEKWTGSTRY